jgi:archaetidylinositol phosphate synthase
VIGTSWTHLLARRLVRPLLGTWVRPNHITFLRMVSGLAACFCFAQGSMGWGGALWVLSAFLDRADGELARIGKLGSEWGHRFDYYVDNAVTALFFAAIGIGLRHTWLGGWSVPLGVVSAGCLLACNLFSEWLERLGPPDTKAYAGKWGFDPDDALYLMGPFAWLGWLAPVLVGAAFGTAFMAVLTGIRLLRLRRVAGADRHHTA